MGISEKVAHLKGLMEGLNISAETPEGKLFAAILDTLETVSDEIADLNDEMTELEDGLDVVSDDLSDVEDYVFEDEDDDEDTYATTCPECEEEIFFDDSILEEGEVICPNCGEKLEFDLSDLANAVEDDEVKF